jgi:diaminopimelate epimerase
MKYGIKFLKMEGCGNDFVVIDNRNGRVNKTAARSPGEFAKEVCARRTGIGSDGLLLLEKSSSCDFKMRFFNPDGSEVSMCGNGARCIALYAYKMGIVGRRMAIETGSGAIKALVKKDSVKVKMTDPTGFRQVLLENIGIDSPTANFINTGVPHVVIFCDDIGTLDVRKTGAAIRYHESFKPVGTNANFVEVVDNRSINIRTYERGVEDETLACGTGAVASALVASNLRGLVSPVNVHTRGGDILTIHFSQDGGRFRDVYLEGSVRIVFEGRI